MSAVAVVAALTALLSLLGVTFTLADVNFHLPEKVNVAAGVVESGIRRAVVIADDIIVFDTAKHPWDILARFDNLDIYGPADLLIGVYGGNLRGYTGQQHPDSLNVRRQMGGRHGVRIGFSQNNSRGDCADIDGRRFAAIFQGERYRKTAAYLERSVSNRRDANVWTSLSLHFVKLSLHRILLPPQNNGGASGYHYRGDIESKAPPVPLGSAIPLGLLLCSGYLVIVMYVLKRADYTTPIGIIGAWPIFALRFSLLTYQNCPSFLEPLYRPLPICQYSAPQMSPNFTLSTRWLNRRNATALSRPGSPSFQTEGGRAPTGDAAAELHEGR